MTKIEITIPFGNEPNLNGRYYPPEVVKEMVENINQKKIFVTNPVNEINAQVHKDVIGWVHMKDVIGWSEEATYNEDGNRIELTLDVNSEEALALLESGFKIVPNGIGKIDSETRQVKYYSLVQFSITKDSAFDKKESE